MKYALLQLSLDQTIDRRELEEASVVAPSVARADCARLQRELFGILVKDIGRDEALALQAALRQRNFPTELIEQSQLPELMPAVRGQALRFEPEAVVLVDLYGREQRYGRANFVFAAAGHVQHLARKPHQKMEWVESIGPRGSISRHVGIVTEKRLANVPEFRVEFFFATEPFRLEWVLAEDGMMRVNNERYKLRDRGKLLDLLKFLGGFLPPERVNQGIKKAASGEELVYPSYRAFEEEIIWSFFQLSRGLQHPPD